MPLASGRRSQEQCWMWSAPRARWRKQGCSLLHRVTVREHRPDTPGDGIAFPEGCRWILAEFFKALILVQTSFSHTVGAHLT